MNWDQVEGKWKQYKGQAKEKWGKFTDDDLDVVDGKRQQIVEKFRSVTEFPERPLNSRRTNSSRR